MAENAFVIERYKNVIFVVKTCMPFNKALNARVRCFHTFVFF